MESKKISASGVQITLYYTLIQPHLLYGLAIWVSIFFCNAQKQLQIRQNNAIKAVVEVESITMFRYNFSYKNLKILKIHDLCKLEIATLMHKYDNSKLPSAFDSLFAKPSNIHCYSRRNNHNHTYYISKFRFASLQKSFRCTGVKIWNNIEKKNSTNDKQILLYCNCKNYLIQENMKLLMPLLIYRYKKILVNF